MMVRTPQWPWGALSRARRPRRARPNRRISFVVRPDSSTKMTCRKSQVLHFSAHSCRRAWISGVSCSAARSVFFVDHAHPAEGVEDGDEGAGEGKGRAEFVEGGAGVAVDVVTQGGLLLRADGALASGAVVEVFDGAQAVALSDELLDEAKGDIEAGSGLLVGFVAFVDGRHDTCSEVVGYRCHGGNIAGGDTIVHTIY